MKTLQLFLLAISFTLASNSLFAQSKQTETFNVSGECGMCKSTIEKAAKEAGASYASWKEDSKQITVKYNKKSTTLTKIQQKIADAGYDNVGVKAEDKAYNGLHDCCKYDRAAPKGNSNKK